MKTKYLISTSMGCKDREGFDSFCGNLRASVAELGTLELVGGITWVPGPGCSNLAFEIEGEEEDAENFMKQLTWHLMPARWTTTTDEINEQDYWVR